MRLLCQATLAAVLLFSAPAPAADGGIVRKGAKVALGWLYRVFGKAVVIAEKNPATTGIATAGAVTYSLGMKAMTGEYPADPDNPTAPRTFAEYGMQTFKNDIRLLLWILAAAAGVYAVMTVRKCLHLFRSRIRRRRSSQEAGD